MVNYIRAEFYKVFRRRYTWITLVVLLALGNVKEVGAVVDRPKALGDIRGVTYIYGVFYRFGLIDVPDEVKEKMNKRGYVAKS